MGSFFLVILVVLFIPFIEGGLLALLLREIHIRHPLPLVEPGYVNAWHVSKPKNAVADPVEKQEAKTESVVDDVADNDGSAEALVEKSVPVPGEASIFDGAVSIPKNLPIDNALDSMMAASPTTIPDTFENRIEESARLKDGLPEDVHHIKDDLDLDDLEDLAAALPKTKIDFAQEDEIDTEMHEPIVPMAKELLGEDFNFADLENQTNQSSLEVALDVREDDVGLVQVSSPFFADASRLIDVGTPQMVLSSFSKDWLQESGGVIESIEGDISSFCYIEESRPMFVRKK